jgi:hypothetical protein
MPTQQQIEQFTLAYHREVVKRLREKPELIEVAEKTLDRWEANGASPNSQPYRSAWRVLLLEGVDAIERRVCNESDEATALRSTPPLILLSQSERSQLRQSMGMAF